jgi:hypothetical protein
VGPRTLARGLRHGLLGSLSFMLAAQSMPFLPGIAPAPEISEGPDFAELLPYRPLPMVTTEGSTEPLHYRGEQVQNDSSGWSIQRGGLQSADLLLVADKIHYNPKTNLVEAEGHIRLEAQGLRLRAERLKMDWRQRTGEAWALELEFDPSWTLKAGEASFNTLKRWNFQDVKVTSCAQEQPGWSLTMSKLSLNLDHFATFHNAKMYVGPVPLLYLPWGTYPAKEARSSGLLPTLPKYSNVLGVTLALPYFQTLGNSADVTFEPEFHQKENPLWAAELRWHPEPTHEGSLSAEYIHQSTDGEYRYAYQFRDLWKREDGWQFSADLNHASDSLLESDYGRRVGDFGGNYFNSSLYLGKSFSFANFSVAASDQRSYFSTYSPSVLEKQTFPTIQSRLYPIGVGLLYFDAGVSAGRMAYRLETPDVDTIPDSSYTWNRADVYTRLYGRLGQWGPFRADVETLARYTAYDASLREPLYTPQTAVGSTLDPSFNQFLVDGKAIDRSLLSGRFKLSGPPIGRTYEDLHFWKYSGDLKHLVEPFVAFTETSSSSADAEIPRFDDVDSRPGAGGSAMGERSLEIGFMQHLMGRSTSASFFSDLVRWKISSKYHFRPILLADGRYEKGWTTIETELDAQPTDKIRISYKATSDLEEKHTDNSLTVNVGTDFGGQYSLAFFSTAINSLLIRQHGIQLAAMQRFWDDRLRLEANANYDYSTIVSAQVGLTYVTPCVAYSVRYTHSALNAVSSISRENKIEFVISLKSLGDFTLFSH